MKKIHEIFGLSEEEKHEMIADAADSERGRVFQAARMLSRKGSLDDYIDFLSENMDIVQGPPTKKITKHYKL